MKKKSLWQIFLVVFIDLLGFGIMIPMLPFYARSMGADAIQIGLLMAAYSAFQIISSPIWGSLSDRMGRRPVLIFTIAGQSIAFFLAAMAPTYAWLIVSRSVAGLFGGNIAVASAYVADVTDESERSKGMGMIGAAFGLGFVFGPAIGGLLISYGAHWPSVVAGSLAFLNLLGVLKFVPEPLSDSSRRAANRRTWGWKDLHESLSKVEIVVPLLMFFFFTFAFVQLEVSFGLFVTSEFGYSERASGLLLAMVGIMMAIVQGGLLGRLTKFFGDEKLIWIGSFVLGLGLILLSAAVFTWMIYLALVILAVGYSLANPCLQAVASKSAGSERRGSVMGIYQSGGGLARIVAPIAAGFFYHLNPRYPMKLGALIVIGAAALWTVRLIWGQPKEKKWQS